MRIHRALQRGPAATDGDGHARRARNGFALPMAILVIAFLTITLAAAYAATTAEQMTNNSQRGESRAYMIAQAGLESFMARRNEPGFCKVCGFPPTTVFESTYVNLGQGVAYVTARRVRVATDKRPAIYLLRSRGIDNSAKAISGSAIGADGSNLANQYPERTVAQLVYWNVNQVQVLSSWTSVNGLDKTGSSGTISGVDNCGKKATVAGVAVPTDDYSANGNFTPTGDPPIQFLGTQAQTNASIKIDWNGILNTDRIQPDYTFTSGDDALANWPDFSDPNYYPVIRVNGDLTLSTYGGRGTLIVMGNLTINGNNLWKGIVMVGGTMTSNGNNTMLGATMSGLNEILTPEQLAAANSISSTTLVSNPASALAKGTKTFQYDSCEVAKAASGLASYSVYPNAWMDNFTTY